MSRLYAQFQVSEAGSFANEMAAVMYGPASPWWGTICGSAERATSAPFSTTSCTGADFTTRGAIGFSIARREGWGNPAGAQVGAPAHPPRPPGGVGGPGEPVPL